MAKYKLKNEKLTAKVILTNKMSYTKQTELKKMAQFLETEAIILKKFTMLHHNIKIDPKNKQTKQISHNCNSKKTITKKQNQFKQRNFLK